MRQREAAGEEIDTSRHPAGQQLEVRNRDSLESFVMRLTMLGATVDEVEAVKEAWPTWDEGDPEYTKRELVRLDDATLKEALAAIRAEHISHTLTEDEQSEQEYRAAVAGNLNEAQLRVVNSTVDGVLEWVGDDPARGRAAYVSELTVPEHRARKTLVVALSTKFGFTDGDVPDDDAA
jgi:hypothetical protein